MIRRSLFVLVVCVLLLSVSGCGGGGPASARAPGCNAQGGSEVLCLVSCNLGCTDSGCALTDIYQNQQIVLTFNQTVAMNSVSSSSVSLRTSAGEEPVGILLTQDNSVTFVPEIRVVGGASFFGFTPQETYEFRLPGGVNEINALRSVSGDPFAKTLTCNLQVTRGILDIDGEPPTSQLRSPKTLSNVAPNTSIVLEFSEIIDNTPFLGVTAGNEPIEVLAGRTRPAAGGGVECNPLTAPTKLRGSWTITNNVILQQSTAMFTPSQVIPTSVCVTVKVTPGVTDLAGTPSQGETHTYITKVGIQPLVPVVESFSDDLMFDRETSGGSWIGGAKPGLLGWDGLHGDFGPQLGTPVGGNVFEVSTDNQLISRTNLTLSGQDETVDDGIFRFTKFAIPAGQTVRFIGRNPARIFVRGDARIEGTLEVNGQSLSQPNGATTNLVGQAGGISGAQGGGAAGGGGGKGGDNAIGANAPRFSGQDGEPVQVPANHAYASMVAATAGRGSSQFPDQNEVSPVTNCTPSTCVEAGLRGFFSIQIAAGGGGGGYDGAGLPGMAVVTPNEFGQNQTQFLGSPGPGGSSFKIFPFPPGKSVMDHFLVGGAGGGGAGSHPYNSAAIPKSTAQWHIGGGGASGGGAIGLRVGRTLTVGASGAIQAKGGRTRASANNMFATPGGGGSGGSVILQVGQVPLQSGSIDVSGGLGGSVLGGFILMQSDGGDGAPGYFRIEAPPDPPTTEAEAGLWAGVTNPPAALRNLAKLVERDQTTGVQSLFFATNQIFPPIFVRYEIVATINGTRTVYSDDPSKGKVALAGEAIEFLIQGASEGAAGQIDPTTATPWRHYVGNTFPTGGALALADDGGTGFRWVILFHQRSNVTINSVTIFLRT